MNNNLVLFYIYIIIILLFLIPLFYLVSKELFQIFYILYFNLIKKNILKIKENQFYYLIILYIKRNQWFICISMLEALLKNKLQKKTVFIFMDLAYCYEKLYYLEIAEYYYLKVLSYAPSNIDILNKLSVIYKSSNKTYEASKINRRIDLLKNNYIT